MIKESLAGANVDPALILSEARRLAAVRSFADLETILSKDEGVQARLVEWRELLSLLKNLGIVDLVRVDLGIVRGLAYYTGFVFEAFDSQGDQRALAGGGRYDGLIEQLGGKPNHAIGFAMGMERILALVELLENVDIAPTVDVYMIRVGEAAEQAGMMLAERLRDQLDGLKLQVNFGGGSFKSQFKKADKSGAAYAIIIGDDEAQRGDVALKSLRVEQEQITLNHDDLIDQLKSHLSL
jgi:histidyl-tRNA synthetase